MDYAEQTKSVDQVNALTYFEYLKLKRKPPKVETTTETKICKKDSDFVRTRHGKIT
jgi:hypothetical protein